MNILLITSSARGHAIAQSLSKSSHSPSITHICPSKNPAIKKLVDEQHVLNILNFDLVLEIAKKKKYDFAFIGPDDPIGMGLADALEDIGIPSIGPKKSLARIEASKGFTRDLLTKYQIDASPAYKVFTESNRDQISSFIDELGGNYVVKYDALKGGKGVKVSDEHLQNIEEGISYANECIDECGRVVIEEKLIGIEFSLISFVSGNQVVDCPVIQDHKRAYNGDTGPNTGGMGTWSDSNHSLPFIEEHDLLQASEYNKLTAKALLEECGENYVGILYGGFIVVKNGVKLIEYNARFGDPEALNILPLLTTDFVDVCLDMIQNSLSDSSVDFQHKATVCKYITPEGYPENKDQKGEKVVFPEIPENARLYLGDISEQEDGSLALGGSRSAGIVGIGDTIEEAEKIAQELCQKVEGPVRFRDDIGTKELIDLRIETVKNIRS